MTGAGAVPGSRDERGSMALELAIVAPALLAMFALILSYGRYTQVTGLLETAARDGARAATQSRSLAEAKQHLDSVVRYSLRGTVASCRDSADDEIVGNDFNPGGDVTVTVSCTVDFSDLGMWGVPGRTTVTRSFVSPLDPYRGVG